MDTWDRTGDAVAFSELWNVLESFVCVADGVTITGGELFDQPEALRELLLGLRGKLPRSADILVYSGFTYTALKPRLNEMVGLIDTVISEPFDLSASQTQALMGSDNQRFHFLTPLGEQRYQSYPRLRDANDDRLDLVLDSEGTGWLVGIPKRGDLEAFRRQLAANGTLIHTTEQPVPQS